jgi:hypothetical protein
VFCLHLITNITKFCITPMLCDDKQAGDEHLLMFFTQENSVDLHSVGTVP